MPDDAALHTLGQTLADGLRAEELRITHDMLLEHMLMGVGVDIVKIDKAES